MSWMMSDSILSIFGLETVRHMPENRKPSSKLNDLNGSRGMPSNWYFQYNPFFPSFLLLLFSSCRLSFQSFALLCCSIRRSNAYSIFVFVSSDVCRYLSVIKAIRFIYVFAYQYQVHHSHQSNYVYVCWDGIHWLVFRMFHSGMECHWRRTCSKPSRDGVVDICSMHKYELKMHKCLMFFDIDIETTSGYWMEWN